MQRTLHKTLIIRFSSVGDIVLSTLLVRVLRRRFPESRIDFAVKSRYAGILQHNSFITRLREFPEGGSWRDLLHFRRAITKEKYDLIIDIHDSLRSRLLTWGRGTVVRVNKRKVARFFLVRCKWNVFSLFGGAPSVAQRYVETVRAYGVNDDGAGLDFFISDATRERSGALLAEDGIGQETPLIVVCPAATHATKMWMKERYAEAAASLAREQKAAIAVLGTTEEAPLCSEIVTRARAFDPSLHVMNLAGRTSLAEAAAVLDRAILVLTNDTGLMHIAAARKRKVVALFGPTTREFGFFPFGTESTVVQNDGLYCRPCTHIGLARCPEGHFRCMREITVQQVVDSARTLLIR